MCQKYSDLSLKIAFFAILLSDLVEVQIFLPWLLKLIFKQIKQMQICIEIMFEVLKDFLLE